MTNKKNKKPKIPWPTKDAMEQIYAQKLWGGEGVDFYSGSGSHTPELVTPYIEVMSSFLSSFKKPPVVCDLGCGDFNIGKRLVKYSERYIAVDIVSDLIAYNKENFQAENLSFHCLDIASDFLPAADCVILRQVLQHLSNKEVQAVLKKLTNYKYILLTEHLPEGSFTPNKDIISGQGTRLKKQSGIDLLAPPFNFMVKESKQLLSVTSNDHNGVIVTMLYEM